VLGFLADAAGLADAHLEPGGDPGSLIAVARRPPERPRRP
jgi:hypothetical protein